MSLSDRWRKHLDELRSQGRLRTLRTANGVDFSSNDYLGYGTLRLTAAAELSRSGAASRLLRGQHPVWDEVEAALAQWQRAEAALVFSSGYLANLGLLRTVIRPGDWVASDARNHASIIDGLRLAKGQRFVYRSLGGLDQALDRARRRGLPGRELFIVTESLFSMDGVPAPLESLVDLARRHKAHLIVDEAHATGCSGKRGRGLVGAGHFTGDVLATVHTGGKALGVPGAFVCGSAVLRDYLVNRCRQFIYTTALPPAVGAWWLDAIERVIGDDEGRERLHANAGLFREALAERGVRAPGESYIVPIVLGDDARAVAAAARLQAAGFDIRAIRPPTVPDGTARLRVSIHADHDDATLRRAAAAVAEVAS
jgi:8-amino-7-oxononanoate synthase